ncbi:hypothetical protein BC628DRAFT_1414850 [Trametes gibbosa]|nr:hypothetical protein BC628DRAFT_1414850 [Trametes gibbosa]
MHPTHAHSARTASIRERLSRRAVFATFGTTALAELPILDWLVVTSLLLVTDVQEWLDRPREARIPGSSSYTVQRWLALIHDTPTPPEPEHPTVDLSLTVPSTPPQSATFPSPGAYWETQSGMTSLSNVGSNGSGSSASYSGEPFTPVTSATSANSSAFFSRSAEDTSPVPPVPGSSTAYSADAMCVRERPKSNPQTMTHSSTRNANIEALGSYPRAQMVDGRLWHGRRHGPRPRSGRGAHPHIPALSSRAHSGRSRAEMRSPRLDVAGARRAIS